MTKSYKEIYIEKKIQEIREEIRKNHIELTPENQEKADRVMKEVLGKQYDRNQKDKSVIEIFDIAKKIHSKAARNEELNITLILYYYAIYNDNIDLLSTLLEKDYNFGYKTHSLNLWVLDELLTSQFEVDEYEKLLKTQEKVIESFYSSIRSEKSKEEKKKITKTFCDILKENPEVAKIPNKNDYYTDLLTKEKIQEFGYDFFINATQEQKKVINKYTIFSRTTDTGLNRLKQLVTTYPKYNGEFYLSVELLNLLTDEEIVSLTRDQEYMYQYAYYHNLTAKVKEILDKNSEFTCDYDFFSRDLFEMLTTEEIANLTDKGKDQLAQLNRDRSYLNENFEHFDYEKTARRYLEKDKIRQKKNAYVKKISSIFNTQN